MFQKMFNALTRNADAYLAALAPEAVCQNPEVFTRRERMLGREI